MASKGPVMMPAPSTYAEACARAQKLVPILAGRAARTEDARRISDETFADLHQTGLLRILQPRAVGGAELPYESLVGVTATLARGCGSTGGCTPISRTTISCSHCGTNERSGRSGVPTAMR